MPSSPNVVGIVKGCGTGCSEMSGHCLMSACIFVVDKWSGYIEYSFETNALVPNLYSCMYLVSCYKYLLPSLCVVCVHKQIVRIGSIRHTVNLIQF